eukprot:scaffold38351_cov63-Phaeocystis_antarctica.AAC.11
MKKLISSLSSTEHISHNINPCVRSRGSHVRAHATRRHALRLPCRAQGISLEPAQLLDEDEDEDAVGAEA